MNNSTWVDVDVLGEMTKRRYYGRVLMKPFLTHAERTEAIRDAEKLLKGIEDRAHRFLLMTLAFLRHHILEADKLDWKESNYGMNWLDEAPVIKMAELLKALQDPEFAKALEDKERASKDLAEPESKAETAEGT